MLPALPPTALRAPGAPFPAPPPNAGCGTPTVPAAPTCASHLPAAALPDDARAGPTFHRHLLLFGRCLLTFCPCPPTFPHYRCCPRHHSYRLRASRAATTGWRWPLTCLHELRTNIRAPAFTRVCGLPPGSPRALLPGLFFRAAHGTGRLPLDAAKLRAMHFTRTTYPPAATFLPAGTRPRPRFANANRWPGVLPTFNSVPRQLPRARPFPPVAANAAAGAFTLNRHYL